MRVPYSALRMHFPDSQSVSREELYHWIGYPENINNPYFQNTCAIRLSLALLGAGFPNPGVWRIQAGKYKDRAIEPRQRKLSHWLIGHLGHPVEFTSGAQAERQIGSKRGVVSFFNIYGDDRIQGHISIVAKDRWGYYTRCGQELDGTPTGYYWTSRRVWFWELN